MSRCLMLIRTLSANHGGESNRFASSAFGKIIRQHHAGLQLGSVERQRADNAVDLTRRTPCATNG